MPILIHETSLNRAAATLCHRYITQRVQIWSSLCINYQQAGLELDKGLNHPPAQTLKMLAS